MTIATTEFRLNGMSPFSNHADEADQRLAEAHALTHFLADTLDLNHEQFGVMNPELQTSVIRGINSLIAYAQYHLAEAHAAELSKRARPAAVAA